MRTERFFILGSIILFIAASIESISMWIQDSTTDGAVPPILFIGMAGGLLVNTRLALKMLKRKNAHAQQVRELYSYAEFGKLSSGLFHDLVNPLTAVSLNVEQARRECASNQLTKADHYITQACTAARYMERFVTAIKKQIGKNENRIEFDTVLETRNVIDILAHKALQAQVEIVFSAESEQILCGNPAHWNQIMLNLISNAIDATASISSDIVHQVVVQSTQQAGKLVFTITDHGVGIPVHDLHKIFQPFFSTKAGKGCGIGLAISKRLVEKEFGGMLAVRSNSEQGTVFTISI